MREFYLGVLLEVIATFRDPKSDPPNQVFDPTTVKLTVEKPGVAPVTYTFGDVDSPIVKNSVGIYVANINLDVLGYWHYRWFSEGVGQTAIRIPFKVVNVMTT